jgi:putative peptidoglycan lipid II flippase
VLFQAGRFHHSDSVYVWGILAGSSIGLLASTLGRLYSSTYYALRDTRTPLRYATIRVAFTIGLGYVCAIPLPGWLGLEARWGAAGLTASAGVAGWIEFALLRRSLNARIGNTGLAPALLARLWGAAAVAAGVAWFVKIGAGQSGPVFAGIGILAVYGSLYFLITYAMGVEECVGMVRRVARGRIR